MTRQPGRRLPALVLAAGLGLCAPVAALAEPAAADSKPVLLVHGYNAGSDANCSDLWGAARAEFDGRSTRTIGYYEGDTECTEYVAGRGNNTTDTPIQDIAKEFANHIHSEYTSKGQSVDIVAHSMGGLVTRVAVLGTREGWAGFPPSVEVDDVVTLGTPQGGITKDPCSDQSECSYQWWQMTREQDGGSGFTSKLHESKKGAADRGFDDPWAKGIDWSLVGSEEDTTVDYDRAIDKGYWAHQKYGFDEDLNNNGDPDCTSPEEIDHQAIRLVRDGDFCLRYWHHGDNGGPYTTGKGWAPLEIARNAINHKGDNLPR
ncbi:hypothetical protein EIL87_19890 [Saccharopolyspora rhizosphaerae]|uniref:GPI inositol-deacylase PGAP1-like alpha/beta domain-containing protein n=1 Tax=Saccharopolyspora rhizosphaerae TaxID=2492662 RepID=A0A426JN63_9PSEU|nr:hypothetical protein [Saccharopolyspora rhizosphaerae]RRO14447.1 hypothetical protein EIL87_19890 [Saccharopolyspora rhizosphaerae]